MQKSLMFVVPFIGLSFVCAQLQSNEKKDEYSCESLDHTETYLHDKGANKTVTTQYLELILENGDVDHAIALINSGEIAVNRRFPNKSTALIKASDKGYYEAVKALVGAGANLDMKDMYGCTAVMFAAYRGFYEIVELLINAGADINMQNNQGSTALSAAIVQGHVDIVHLLVEAGADVNTQDNVSCTALMHAAKGAEEVFQLLIESGADINARDKIGNTILMYAVMDGSKQTVRLAIEAGADFNAQTDNNTVINTALTYSIHRGDLEITMLLVDAGADINAQTMHGKTALLTAAYCKRKDIVHYLIDSGADIHLTFNHDYNVLFAAVDGLCNVAKERLIETGKVTNKSNKNYVQALYAREVAFLVKESERIVRMLLDAGADIRAKRSDGQNVLMFVADQRIDQRLLIDLMLLFVEEGIDINEQDMCGETTLIRLVKSGFTEGVRLLLNKGADVEIKDMCGKTALIHAVEGEYLEIINLLINAGADVCATDNQGNIVFSYVTEFGLKSDLIRNVLIGAGANKYTLRQKCGIAATLTLCTTFVAAVLYLSHTPCRL